MGKSVLSYTEAGLEIYIKELKQVAALSSLFSGSKSPLIYYRATENIYSHAFNAINVSRADCTADAIYESHGVGIKTFLEGAKSQKIAEFNESHPLYKNLIDLALIRKISELRNERMAFTIRNYGLKDLIYHCVVRSEGKISVYEEPMFSINIAHLRILDKNEKSYLFTDGIQTYEFYPAKSTLFKTFDLKDPFIATDVVILKDPYDALNKLFTYIEVDKMHFASNLIQGKSNALIIPLYSENKKVGRFVGQKSGLNTWNAAGRVRDFDEVYIPYPCAIRKAHPDFFPAKDKKWPMRLPNGKYLQMKICQQGGKAIMSDPNKGLGKWLLREVLNLKPGQLLTYDDLIVRGIDSVLIWREDSGFYSIDFVNSSIEDN